jgi:uncharacterized protein YdbL (DUF1318 family)
MNRRRLAIIFCITTALLAGALAKISLADDSETALRQRVEQRYPQIRAAKEDDKIGETYTGTVEAVDPKFLSDSDLKKLIDDENTDRAQLYQIIATQTQSTPDVVAQRAAARNFDHAEKGEYLKYQDRGWQKKQ